MNKQKSNKKIKTSTVITGISALTLSAVVAGLSFATFGTESIIVPLKDIDPYIAPVVAEDFTVIDISKRDAKLFKDFADSTSLVDGKYPTTKLFAGQPIKSKQFADLEQLNDTELLVSNPNNRGIYLPISRSFALEGSLKANIATDFYYIVRHDTVNGEAVKTDKKPASVVPFRLNYSSARVIDLPDAEFLYVFFEFPMQDSTKYTYLKSLLTSSADDNFLIAVAQNAKPEEFSSSLLDSVDFTSGLMTNPNYFESLTNTDEAPKPVPKPTPETSNPQKQN